MATEQMFTSLPTTANAQMTDITCAVQGYTSPSNLGLSVQETWQQVYNLFSLNLIQYYAGNPNGFVAGTTYQFCWDTVDKILFVCTTSGNAATAVWTAVTNSEAWANVQTSTQQLSYNANYITNNGAVLVTYTLPTVAPLGTRIRIAGRSTGGWTIVYGSGQSIIIGSLQTTVTTGSLSSTNANDCVEFLCTAQNATFTLLSGVGNFTIV